MVTWRGYCSSLGLQLMIILAIIFVHSLDQLINCLIYKTLENSVIIKCLQFKPKDIHFAVM